MVFAVMDQRQSGKILQKRRKSLGLTQEEIAQSLKISVKTIQNLETGRTASLQLGSRKKYAELLQWPLDDVQSLMGADEDPEGAENNVSQIGGTVPMRMLPIYRFVPANRMGGREDFYSDQADQDPEMVEAYAPSKNCIVIVLDGDCMEPKYKSGEKVIIDFVAVENGSRMIPGACYFIQTRGEDGGKNTFKAFVGIEDGEYLFRCLNQKYKTVMRIKPPFNAGLAVATIA